MNEDGFPPLCIPHLDGIIPKLGDYIAWITYGYGVRPGYPLL